MQILQSCTKHLICIHHSYLMGLVVNSLAPGRSEGDSKNIIFNFVLLIGIFRSSHDNALRWMPQDLTDDKSTLAQVMAWCRQATSHYLSQCWLSSSSPYGVARPQWVKTNRTDLNFQSVNTQNKGLFLRIWTIPSPEHSTKATKNHLWMLSP